MPTAPQKAAKPPAPNLAHKPADASRPSGHPALKRTLAVLGLLVVLAVAAAWLRSAFLPAVSTVKPVRGSAAEVVYATGVVEPVVWAKVVTLVRKRIVDVCRCEGLPVAEGDVLVRLDDAEERAVLSELEARRQRLLEDAERMRPLVERKITSQTSLDEKLTQIREYEARILAQKERIADLVLRAPLDGIVLRRDGEVGEIAGTGAGDVLFWIGQPKPLRVTADVNEEDILKVRKGQKVLLRHEGQGSAPLPATVSTITPKGDPGTKTFRVYLALPESTPLKVGMTVEANIVVEEVEDAMLIPPAALRDGAVFVVGDGRLVQAPIETGVRGTRLIEIRKGLDMTSDVVVSPPATLKAGDRVRVVPAKGSS